ncbi:hypothetical protein H5395_16695 [Paracoccus sp. MC1854]|uniref:hypothetical protein n=1 Tax=Paracoccus sp. MC1854 TaxID=2760306 RepID=UPI0015FF41EF|nr:hypothetical protein [Paracoccus sp. MC1854]MBB1493112.1 hypothetical protein [Paracoccus sp. MC1854]
MIRFDASGKQIGEARVSSVQRYDAAGRLVVPSMPEAAAIDLNGADLAAEAMMLLEPSAASRLSAPANTGRAAGIAAVRSVALRYQHHPALKLNNIAPNEWTALFQALVWQESRFNPRARRGRATLECDF